MNVSSVVIQFTIIDLLSRGVDKICQRMERLANGNMDVQRSFNRMAKSVKTTAIASIAVR